MKDPEVILDELNGWLENRYYETIRTRSLSYSAEEATRLDWLSNELLIIRKYLRDQIAISPAEEYHWWSWLGDCVCDGILGVSKGFVDLLEWHRAGVEKTRSKTRLRLVGRTRSADSAEAARFRAPPTL